MSGQEREALGELVRLYRIDQPITAPGWSLDWFAAWEKAEAALNETKSSSSGTAREEPSAERLSSCCKAEVRLGGGTGPTRYYVCSECEKACGVARGEDTERSEWKGHKLKLTIEDGYVYADLICPETGCDPPNICGGCGRSWDDGETERCYDCPTEKPKGCWLDGWDQLAEFLHGKVVVIVDIDAEWDTDVPSLTVVWDTERPDELARLREGLERALDVSFTVGLLQMRAGKTDDAELAEWGEQLKGQLVAIREVLNPGTAAAMAELRDTERPLTRSVSACCKAWIEVRDGYSCSACGKPCGKTAPARTEQEHTPTPDCRCADCVAYDESSPL